MLKELAENLDVVKDMDEKKREGHFKLVIKLMLANCSESAEYYGIDPDKAAEYMAESKDRIEEFQTRLMEEAEAI